jgi:hypothetical protein
MGLLDRIQGKEAAPKKVASNSSLNEELSLSAEETKILLHLIKNSNFKGDSVELVYNLTKKLQSVLGILTED